MQPATEARLIEVLTSLPAQLAELKGHVIGVSAQMKRNEESCSTRHGEVLERFSGEVKRIDEIKEELDEQRDKREAKLEKQLEDVTKAREASGSHWTRWGVNLGVLTLVAAVGAILGRFLLH